MHRYEADTIEDIPLNLLLVDYDMISKIIDEWRKESMKYLEAVLKLNNRGGRCKGLIFIFSMALSCYNSLLMEEQEVAS